jgi:hypothetical protein
VLSIDGSRARVTRSANELLDTAPGSRDHAARFLTGPKGNHEIRRRAILPG